MSDDVLLKYQTLIDELREKLGSANFDKFFQTKTKALSKPDQFLLKMEMNRLSQPVQRFIDLRGQVTGDVKPYEHQGKQHFMDNIAIEVFEKAIKQHGGYTLAVYEAVMNTDNNHKVMQRKAKETGQAAPILTQVEEKKVPLTHLVEFASYETRSEERMNYSIRVKIALSSKNIIEANTSDISVSGCKVKLPNRYEVTQGQMLRLRLVGLEQDFELGLKDGVQYEVVAVDSSNSDFNYIRLKRTYDENNSAFDDFLRSFIHGNKRRYKVNIDNTLEAVIVKGYEQYYLPRVSSLFLFLSENNQQLQPTLSLTNENNINSLRYFIDENKHPVLSSILNSARIQALTSQTSHVKTTTLYSFNHIAGGKLFFYTATDLELSQTPALKELFLGFGSHKPSWRTFVVQMVPCLDADACIPLSLPETAGTDIAKFNKPPSPRVQGMLKDIKYLVLLTDITTASATAEYQKNSFKKEQVNALKQFGHAKQKAYAPLDAVALEYINLRAETRYLYKTTIEFEQEESVKVVAHTLDFSENGLQIELAEPTRYEKGDLLLVAFPDLQKITKKHQLSKLPYEIMAISKTKTIVNLRSYQPTPDTPHQGSIFFTQLIANNKDKLQASEESPKVPGLSAALRNIVTKNVCQFPFYLHKKASNIQVGAIAKGLYPTHFHFLLQHFNLLTEHFSLAQFMPENVINDIFLPRLKTLKRQDPPLQIDLYIRFNPLIKSLDKALMCDYVPTEYTSLSKKSFITASAQQDLFFGFRIFLSRTGRPDTEYLAKELSYISQYAQHKARVLEEELWSVVCVGEMIEITDELTQRYNIEAKLLHNMALRKKNWLQKLTLS